MGTGVRDLLFSLIPIEADAAALGAPFDHDRTLVAVSMLVAVAGAYTYLELASRGRAHAGLAGALWIAASGAMLGAGLWATHFVGMLAFESPLAHGFSMAPTLISAFAGIGCGSAAFLLGGPAPNWPRYLLAGACVSAGAIVMHYLGMQGLRIEASLSYRPDLVAATSLGGLACGLAAFFLAHRLDSSWSRAVAAFPIGAIAAGLHYTDMAATVIAPRPAFAAPAAEISAIWMAVGVAITMIALVAAALLAVSFDRRRGLAAALGSAAEDHVVVIPNPSAHASADTVIVDSKSEVRRR